MTAQSDLDTSGGQGPGARSCAGCTLCCKLPSIDALDKPAGQWCRHCAPASGCRIYAERPQVCRDFRCGWLAEPDYPDYWRPAQCRMILIPEKGRARLSLHVDPSRTGAWMKAPWRTDLIAWAAELVPEGTQVLVLDGARLLGILPDGPVDLGQLAAGGDVVLEARPGGGWRYRRVPVA